MKRILAILFASLLSFSAFAIGLGNDNPPGGGGGIQTQVTNVDVSGRISNDVRAKANAFAAAKSKSSSNSAAINLSTTGGNTLSNAGNTVTFNEAAVPTSTRTEIQNGDYTIKNVPAFALGNVYPTAPCMGSSQVGGAGVGFSIGIGTSWTDAECSLRETARSFLGLGLKEDSLAILCTSEYAAAAPSCVKLRSK